MKIREGTILWRYTWDTIIVMDMFCSVLLLECIIFIICVLSSEIDTDHGGWITDEAAMIAQPGPCNIEVRDSMSQQEFLKKYAYHQPVIVRDLSDNSMFQEMCRRDKIIHKYGHKVIRLSSANTYSYSKVDVTLEKYLSDYLKPQKLDQYGNETFYWFGDNDHREWAELFDAYHAPPYSLPGMTAAYSFGVADAGTGVPFHFHGPGFAEVIFGSKRWFLYPPHQQPKFHPNITTLQWLIEEYPKLHGPDMPYECTIGPGEAIYFPDHWWHGTLNIKASVFISTFLG